YVIAQISKLHGKCNHTAFNEAALVCRTEKRSCVKVPAMKIHRRNFLLASSAALLAKNNLSFGSNKQNDSNKRPQKAHRFSKIGKQITVYMTAAKTDYRISRTDTLSFKPVGQPKETQICVFVDPSRKFQTFLGIGGALTDASAETFALLPK